MRIDSPRASTLPVYTLEQHLNEAAERLDALALGHAGARVDQLRARLDEAKRRLVSVGGRPGSDLEREVLALRDDVASLWLTRS